MAKKLSEGVGKKIVEALKKQSEIEITPVPLEKPTVETEASFEEMPQAFVSETPEEEDFLEQMASDNYSMPIEEEPIIKEEPIKAEPAFKEEIFVSGPQPQPISENFIKELDNFEVPSNIAVLKKLIAQLPSGVSKQTGALIIKQTMEALGISMKSVLQEAQQVQEGLNNSAKECFSTIQEYKKQIIELEKQAQNHQKQYSALNELISLFIQTGV